MHLREPSSYTPLGKEFQKAGGPTSLTLGGLAEENRRQIAKFSEKDALAYEAYEEELARFVDIIDPLLDHAPADLVRFLDDPLLLKMANYHKIEPAVKAARAAVKSNNLSGFYELLTAPTTKILDKWFESEPLKATLATDSCIGALISPDSPGSGYVLLHHVMGELEGIRGAWGYPEGGMGAVSGAIARAAEEAGAEIVVNTDVQEILVDPHNNHATGVVVALTPNAEASVIESDIVLSNATPKVTFLDLIPESKMDPQFRSSVQRIDYTSPVTKINVAVNKLPDFLADPNPGPNQALPHHQCTIHLNCENSSLLTGAYEEATQNGTFSKKPMIEMTIPSVLDKTLVPEEGHHVCLFFTQYTPYELSSSPDGQQRRPWDSQSKEEYAGIVFDTVEKYAPGFKDSIVGKEVLTPPDLEATFGLTGGNIFHGSMSLDQLYLTRPIAAAQNSKDTLSPECPIQNLLLCGSGAHPGGGVMGAPGRNAARTALELMAGARWAFK